MRGNRGRLGIPLDRRDERDRQDTRHLGRRARLPLPRHQPMIEPLAAAYHRHAITSFEDCLWNNVLKMSDAIARVKPVCLDIEPGKDGWPVDLFRNLNSPADL